MMMAKFRQHSGNPAASEPVRVAQAVL